MTQKSNWIEEEDNYWSESKSNAFDFDDENKEMVFIYKTESNDSKQSMPSLKKPENQLIINNNQNSDLKLSDNLVEKQIQNYLNAFEKEEKPVLSKLSPKEAIDCMVNGINVYLDVYKGKEEKLNLLDFAIESNDANVITCVVLYLQRTLKASIFNYELSVRSLAADHYVYYLKEMERIDELTDILAMLGRHEDSAMILYNQAISCSNTETKIRNLKNCLRSHFTTGGNNVQFWSSFISEQILLLEIQSPIESDDLRQEMEGSNQLFQQIGRTPIINLPVITTLYYCCLYHYWLPETQFASPKYISKLYQLSQKQFVWTALSALAKSNRWQEIDALFQYKSWLGNKKMKSCIPFEKVLSVLKKNEAPQELLERYLELIEDNEVKYELAKELKIIKIVIDTLIKIKDRKRLEELLSKTDINSKEYSSIENALKATTIKWKN